MIEMTMNQLYDKLNSPEFLHPEEGDLFYNYYLYQYPAEKEYEIREQIVEFKRNLRRPSTYVDALIIDIFGEFCRFMDQKKFLRHPSMLKYLADKEQADPANAASVQDTLTRNAHSREFLEYLHQRILGHITQPGDEYERPYVFLYGIGSIFPYLRVNELLAMYEDFNITHKYRIVVFYPGHREGNSFSLFGLLPDRHIYRAIMLVNE